MVLSPALFAPLLNDHPQLRHLIVAYSEMCIRDRNLRVHPARRDHRTATRRHGGGFRLRHSFRRRQHLCRRAGRPPAGAAAHAAGHRPDGRSHHHADRPTQPVLAQLRGDRQGPRQHPPLPEAPAARRGHPARQAPAGESAGRPDRELERAAPRADQGAGAGIQSERFRRAAGRHRPCLLYTSRCV